MPQKKDFDVRHPLLTKIMNVLLWGTVGGGLVIMLVLQTAQFLIIGPIFGVKVPQGSDLSTICFSTAFLCSVGYAVYMTYHWPASRFWL